MATFVQTNVGLHWGGYDLSSTVFNAIGLSIGSTAVDDTVYGDTFMSNASGLSSVTLEGEGYWSSTEDAALFSSLGTDDTVFTVTPVDQAAGSPALFSKLTASEYNPISGSTGEMAAFKLTGEGRGEKAVSGEILVVPATYSSSSNTVTNASIGAVSATQKIYSALHVTAASGTLDVTVLSASSDWSSSTTRITHTQFGAIGAEMLSTAGPITDAYWRVYWTISGGGSFDFIVSLAII